MLEEVGKGGPCAEPRRARGATRPRFARGKPERCKVCTDSLVRGDPEQCLHRLTQAAQGLHLRPWHFTEAPACRSAVIDVRHIRGANARSTVPPEPDDVIVIPTARVLHVPCRPLRCSSPLPRRERGSSPSEDL